ncbi:hypothetical protein ZYGR_0I07080 [Zygosaccharomyces rouxii]|uniref:ZYRO0C16742p n=2 Tax=Zygosaccharomyces rouxii TaxID=4956 RepID=C5DUH2_ZYGRC|nr:uncharacterized protein ZYRO0C16742g [Zygosaccharomyces rouxii]KAH9201397.1 mannose-6-phosphate receptor binding domain-containing protein [Zygosaccharomyces rouxii]GAV48411.1 hypothetical protein ZYGR_0I07080 [Zygosaccharomyces rouxii]CAR27433.1 ZYRO0C16742p [Zygosaccharomyces rouxii]
MALKITRKFVTILLAALVFLTTVRYYATWPQHIKESNISKKQIHNRERSQDGNHEGRNQELFCAVTNPTSGSYIDLSQLSSTPNRSGDNDKQSPGDSKKTRWSVRGWGYGVNFTLGICSSPVTEKERPSLANTTGGFYQNSQNEIISIGDFSTSPTLLGNKKLTMKYENGSMCANGRDRKSTLLNFVCDKEIASEAQISYIGSLHDCSYFFEVRSVYACPTSNTTNEVNVLGIFIGIFAVFFIVEFAGRRWLYEKVKNHFEAKSNQLPTSFSPVRPRWDIIENESNWKYGFKKIGHLTSATIRKITSLIFKLTNGSGSTTRGGPIRLNSSSIPSNRSQDSFIRDMEQQNNIIDSLEVVSRQSSTTSLDRRE